MKTRKYSQRSLNSLNGIHPDLRLVIDSALQDSPLDFIVIEGLRTKERQKQLVDSGASKTMNSRHLTGHAVDLLPIGLNGKPEFAWPLYDKLGPSVKKTAKAEGVDLDWGGDWKTFKDGPHFQLSRDTYPEGEFISTAKPPVERTSKMQSKTIKVSGGQIVTGVGVAATAVVELQGPAQYMVIAGGIIIVLTGMWLMKDRIRRWAEGDR